MILNELVLQKLADWRPAGGERSILAIPDEGAGWTVAIAADRRDDVGCLLWEIALGSTFPAAPGGPTLQSWAQGAADRVTGLLEALKVVEIDPLRGEALLRSDEPAWKGDDVAYYEVLLKGTTGATVRRFQAAREGTHRRQQMAFALTHEVLAKLVADLAAAR